MTTETTPLTIADLGRYFGKKVQVDLPQSQKFHNKIGKLMGIGGIGDPMAEIIFDDYDAKRFPVDTDWCRIRPLLRPLSSVTSEEARECFRLAFGFEQQIQKHYYGGTMCIEYYPQQLFITDDGGLSQRIIDIKLDKFKPVDNATVVIDYLASLSIDIRGMLQKGLAVEEQL